MPQGGRRRLAKVSTIFPKFRTIFFNFGFFEGKRLCFGKIKMSSHTGAGGGEVGGLGVCAIVSDIVTK